MTISPRYCAERMPLYNYECTTCGAQLEILHGVGKTKSSCGLDCQRRDAGAFGQGTVQVVLAAANVATSNRGRKQREDLAAAAAGGTLPSFGDVKREALRQKALRHLGGELTERDLDKLRDKGVTVYRKDGKDSWAKTGGGPDTAKAPAKLTKPDS